LATDYAARAVVLLRHATERGFTEVEQIKTDTDLDPLRQRDDFKNLLAELKAGQKRPKE
jgi:hypothetical protein